MQFIKYHALGNDYLVLQTKEWLDITAELDLQPDAIKWICDRHRGIGADGILVPSRSLHDSLHSAQAAQAVQAAQAQFGVRILNPDGSEAEKSGNGLRIFARALYDAGVVDTDAFAVETRGGPVRCQILECGQQVRVEMGQVTFGPQYQFDHVDLLNRLDNAGIGHTANIGNPHCVFFCKHVSVEETQRVGPLIESDARFPQRTNVQFARVIDRHTLQLEIWERGAGYTLASGSSSCAACAVAVRLGLCDCDAGPIAVHMPGGVLDVSVADDFHVQQTGPVTRIATIHWVPEFTSPDY